MAITTNLVTITIDDHTFEAPVGALLLDVAKKNGVYIPHFCYLEGLPPYAGCRMCLVQIEGRPSTIPGAAPGTTIACNTPVADGMVVHTQTEQLYALQQGVLGLIISDHPDRCLTCPRMMHCPPDYICLRDVGAPYRCSTCAKNRRCDLQAMTEFLRMHEHDRYYKEQRHYYWWKWQQEAALPRDRANPFLERDYNECIVCARCIRICDDVRGQAVYDLLYRGPKAQVGTALGLPLHDSGCEFCGACVDVCPVNTLMDKRNKWDGPGNRVVSTTCSYCSVGCQIQIDIKDDHILRAIPDPLGPVNGRDALPGGYGHVCVLGRYGHDYVHSQERLTAPLIKRNGRFEEVSWHEALSHIAEQLGQFRLGGRFAAIAGGQVTNEEAYLLQKFARVVMQSNHVDHIGRFEQAPSEQALGGALGIGAATNPFSDLARSKAIMVVGSNATVTSNVGALYLRQAARKGTPLIIVDPRRTELAAIATLWLQPRPGSDRFLLAAMAKVILDEGLADDAFVADRTEGIDALRASLENATPEWAERLSGVPAADVAAAARLYASQRPSAILYGMGVTQQAGATETVQALSNLALLTGNLGVMGGGLYPLRIHANSQGASDMGLLPDRLPGQQPLQDDEARRRLGAAWGAVLPAEPGLTLTEMVPALRDGRLQALFVLGENLVRSYPDPEAARQALQAAPFVVVSDVFMTETAELADIVLPAAAPQEKDGTYTNVERRVQRLRAALEAPGEAQPDWRTLTVLAQLMGADGFAFRHPSEVMQEISRLAPIYGGVSYSRLDAEGLQWPCPTPDHPGTPLLFSDPSTNQRFRFVSLALQEPPADVGAVRERPSQNGQFSLLMTQNRYQAHTGEQSRRVPGLVWFYPEDRIEIHPLDAEPLGIADGDTVRVISEGGEATSKARLTDDAPRGAVAFTSHFESTPLLATAPADPSSHTPALKALRIRLERA